MLFLASFQILFPKNGKLIFLQTGMLSWGSFLTPPLFPVVLNCGVRLLAYKYKRPNKNLEKETRNYGVAQWY